MPLHPQAAAALQTIAALGLPPVTDVTPAQARANATTSRRAVEVDIEPVGRTEDRIISGPGGPLPLRIYRSDDRDHLPLIMLFHGGGWVVGDLETEDTTCRGLCRRVGAVVVSVDYRLAPETRFPGAVEDCYAATQWAVTHADELGIDASLVATSGTSAGGNLAGAVAMAARDRGGPAIAHQVLFCPVTDSDFDRPSYIRNAVDYGLTRAAMVWFWDQYTGAGQGRHHPYAALIRAKDLSGLPDATVIAAEYDPLVDEAVVYADALRAAGVDVSCRVYAGMTHAFNFRVGAIDAARLALDEAADRVMQSFAKARG